MKTCVMPNKRVWGLIIFVVLNIYFICLKYYTHMVYCICLPVYMGKVRTCCIQKNIYTCLYMCVHIYIHTYILGGEDMMPLAEG